MDIPKKDADKEKLRAVSALRLATLEEIVKRTLPNVSTVVKITQSGHDPAHDMKGNVSSSAYKMK